MKKTFLILCIISVSVMSTFARGEAGTGSGTVIVMQNKPEIDAQLKAFAKKFADISGVSVVVKTCGGDACSLATQLRADFNAGEAPDIFIIDGISGYNVWKKYIADLSGESWVKDTDVAFKVGNKTYGFPIAIEGWGMAYNKDLLDKAGIDPKTLTNYDAYKAAFKKLDGMKARLGIDSVVSMAAGSGMGWVTAHHNLNSYLSNGLARNDRSVVDRAAKGKLDTARFREYAQWVKLLFDYSNQRILTTGDYDAQVGAFANQKAVFLHQGNWVEPNLAKAKAKFPRGFAPHGSMKKDTNGIFVSAPTWYVVNKNGNTNAAKAFLKYMAETPEGHDYMVNQILAIPAFKSVKLQPKAPLSVSILNWSKQGKTYAWNQYYLPGGFRDEQIAPIYQQLAQKAITLDQFIDLMTKEFATLKK